MKYFVVAQRSCTAGWTLFGPWEQIEKADEKIAKLSYNDNFVRVELARVLEDEDSPDWVGYDHKEGEEDDE
jgi:hypothetical protein